MSARISASEKANTGVSAGRFYSRNNGRPNRRSCPAVCVSLIEAIRSGVKNFALFTTLFYWLSSMYASIRPVSLCVCVGLVVRIVVCLFDVVAMLPLLPGLVTFQINLKRPPPGIVNVLSPTQ